MDFLKNILNNDVMSIIDDYDKDTENFDKVISQMKCIEDLREETDIIDDDYETYQINYMYDYMDCIINNWKRTLIEEETGDIIYRVEDYEVEEIVYHRGDAPVPP